jgi:hypothetical protein
MRVTAWRLLLTVSCLLLAGGCTESPAGPVATPSATDTAPPSGARSTPTSGVHAGYSGDTDALSPLVITTVSPDPVPVTGTDGKVHLVYELQILNASPRPATITAIDTLAAPSGRTVASLSAAQVGEVGLLVGSGDLTPTNQISAGRALIVLEEGVYASRNEVPSSVTHRVTATFGAPPAGNAFAALYPDETSDIGGEVVMANGQALVIGPPVAGDDWFALNACCTLTSHRGAMLPMGGRINGAERYAIDYARIDINAHPLLDVQAGTIVTFTGDRTKNESYLAWDQPILAVADGTVRQVVSDAPDIAPGALPEGVAIGKLTGNLVTLDIGGGVYAQYGHLRQGSPTVKVGDSVKRGQVIGRLGNSGNTSEAHLHFQLDRAVAPLIGDNVPFEIDTLTVLGTVTADGLTKTPTDGPATRQLPLAYSVTSYPKTS